MKRITYTLVLITISSAQLTHHDNNYKDLRFTEARTLSPPPSQESNNHYAANLNNSPYTHLNPIHAVHDQPKPTLHNKNNHNNSPGTTYMIIYEKRGLNQPNRIIKMKVLHPSENSKQQNFIASPKQLSSKIVNPVGINHVGLPKLKNTMKKNIGPTFLSGFNEAELLQIINAIVSDNSRPFQYTKPNYVNKNFQRFPNIQGRQFSPPLVQTMYIKPISHGKYIQVVPPGHQHNKYNLKGDHKSYGYQHKRDIDFPVDLLSYLPPRFSILRKRGIVN